MAEPDGMTVLRNDDRNRYEVRRDGKVVGFVLYQTRPGQVVLIHTEIEPEYEGQGVGGVLAKGTLDDIRARGEAVVPLCPFIASYIKRHPAYADLVAPAAG